MVAMDPMEQMVKMEEMETWIEVNITPGHTTRLRERHFHMWEEIHGEEHIPGEERINQQLAQLVRMVEMVGQVGKLVTKEGSVSPFQHSTEVE